VKKYNRRQMLVASGGLLGVSLFNKTAHSIEKSEEIENSRKIMVVGGHPDDPESGCGGTICKLTAAGHNVVVVYLTRGEAGLEGKSHDEAARIRASEAGEACKVMNARPLFAGQVDGNTVINKDEYSKMARIIEEETPEIVFTHWPIDTHPDHRVASNLVYNAWNRFRWDEKKAFDLYYYEVLTGEQTQNFHPTHYVDITETADLKKEATMKHACQNPAEWYGHHEKMGEFRGLELRWDCKQAEAFVRQGMSDIL